MNIITKIEKAHYMATEHDVEALAALHLANVEAASGTDGQYLRIMLAALKAKYGNGGVPRIGRRRLLTDVDRAQHVATLAEHHARLYPFVLKGITTPDVADDATMDVEARRARATVRNNRAGFARSATSTIKSWIKAGGDIRGLDVTTATKTALRAFTRSQVAPDAAAHDPARSALGRLTGALKAMATEDPDSAREATERAMEELQQILTLLEEPAPAAGKIVHDGAGRRPRPRAREPARAAA